MEGQNQRTDTPADFTALWYDCQKQPPEELYKKVVLENFAIFTGKQLGFLFNKVASLQARNFFKKEIPTQLFPVDIAKFLRLPILKNICERLLPDYFNGSLIHRPNGLRSILYDSVRLQGPSPWPSFLLLIFFYLFFLLYCSSPEPSPDPRSKI